MELVDETSKAEGIAATCDAVDVWFYWRRGPELYWVAHRPPPPRSLVHDERRAVLDVLHEDRFVDLAPAQVFATLLDEKRYLCSERTMYRILAANDEVRERRAQRGIRNTRPPS